MSSLPKSSLPNSGAARAAGLYRVAIVGAASLKAKEVSEILRERNFPAADVRLLDDEESLGQLEALGDEMSFIQSVRAEQFENVDFAFFACDVRSTRESWKLARDLGDTIVDLSYVLEEESGVPIRSPWVERQLSQSPMPTLQPVPVDIAHPAATVLALLALRCGNLAKVERIVATVFEPASEQGQKGIDELQEQTVNMLSFHEMPKNLFDIQVAFNLVARFGSNSHLSLDRTAARISRHYRTIAPQAITPAVQLLQAPVFHGYGFSVCVEFGNAVSRDELSRALAGDHVVVNPEESPTMVSSAGQDEIQVAVKADGNNKNVAWIWATADNLRLAAFTAVECAESMTASRPRGQIQ
jgi:aspartate-semialdehyde dehydrogenase